MTQDLSNLDMTSSFAENLHQAEIIKQNMTELLRNLETKAAGKTVEQPGGWRHHALDWAEQNPAQNPPPK